jgi:hypothetical protein
MHELYDINYVMIYDALFSFIHSLIYDDILGVYFLQKTADNSDQGMFSL